MTPATLTRLLPAANARLRAQLVAARPQVQEVRRALTQVEREIANYGKVRDALQQSVARILVGVDGSLTVEARPGGLLGLIGNLGQLACGEGQAMIEPSTVSVGAGSGG